jgi:hypothetical protein
MRRSSDRVKRWDKSVRDLHPRLVQAAEGGEDAEELDEAAVGAVGVVGASKMSF